MDQGGRMNGGVQTTNRITGSRRWWALGAVLVTMFFASLDQTVVSTAMPVIIGDLKGLSIYAWVFTAYMMASAITVPIYGKLSDVYGRKPFYVFGLGLFIVGSALSGQAHNMLQLVLYRAVQGIGAGAMMSMPRATIGDIFNPRERGKWMGVMSSVFGLSSIIGPFVGGWVTDTFGWRWVFYMNLPVALIALVSVVYALPRVRAEAHPHVDWAGSGVLVLALVPMLLGFTWAGDAYAWGSWQILGLFLFSAVMWLLFFAVEARAKEPVIAPVLFKNNVFTTTNTVGLLVAMGMFGSLMFLPLFVQGVLGLSAQNSGVVLTPMMLSFIVGSIISGQIITRTGRYKLLATVGSLILVGGMFLLQQMGTETTWPLVVRNMIVLGIGIGSLLPLLNIVVQNAFPYRMMGMVNATQQFVRSLGGVIAAPIFGTILANAFKDRLAQAIPPQLQQAFARLPEEQRQGLANPQGLINADAQAALRAKFSALGAQGEALYNQFIHAVRAALAHGTHELFTIGLFVGIAAFLATFLLPEVRLQTDEFFEDKNEATTTGKNPGERPSTD